MAAMAAYNQGKVIIMYCTKCGNKNDESSSFCGFCGAPLVKDNENTSSSYVNPDLNNQYLNTNNYNNVGQNGYYNQNQNANSSRINSIALAGFITSCGCVFLYGLAGLVGLILSLVGFYQTSVKGERGKGFAIAGIVIGCFSIAATILVIILFCNVDSNVIIIKNLMAEQRL